MTATASLNNGGIEERHELHSFERAKLSYVESSMPNGPYEDGLWSIVRGSILFVV